MCVCVCGGGGGGGVGDITGVPPFDSLSVRFR